MGHTVVFEKEERLMEKRSPWKQGGRVFCMDVRKMTLPPIKLTD
nr:MAG TPA: hypothetical protein [Caudoviricetes sp.]